MLTLAAEERLNTIRKDLEACSQVQIEAMMVSQELLEEMDLILNPRIINLLPDTPSEKELYIHLLEMKGGMALFKFANSFKDQILDNSVIDDDCLTKLKSLGSGWCMVRYVWSTRVGHRVKKWVDVVPGEEKKIRDLCFLQKQLKDKEGN